MATSVTLECRPFPRSIEPLPPEWMTHWTRSSISTSHSAINNIRHPVELSLVVAGVRAALIYHNGRWFWEATVGEAGRFFNENKQKIIIIKMKSGRSSLAAANGSPPGSAPRAPARPTRRTRYTRHAHTFLSVPDLHTTLYSPTSKVISAARGRDCFLI